MKKICSFCGSEYSSSNYNETMTSSNNLEAYSMLGLTVSDIQNKFGTDVEIPTDGWNGSRVMYYQDKRIPYTFLFNPEQWDIITGNEQIIAIVSTEGMIDDTLSADMTLSEIQSLIGKDKVKISEFDTSSIATINSNSYYIEYMWKYTADVPFDEKADSVVVYLTNDSSNNIYSYTQSEISSNVAVELVEQRYSCYGYLTNEEDSRYKIGCYLSAYTDPATGREEYADFVGSVYVDKYSGIITPTPGEEPVF